MTATLQDLAGQVMFMLGKNDAQTEVSAEDYAAITRVYGFKLAELQHKDMAYWADGEIPAEALLPVARIIAQEVAPAFGTVAPQEQDDNGAPITMGLKGLRDLKRLMARDPSGLPTPGIFF